MDELFMEEALAEARLAGQAGDVPVGAVIVQNGQIIARAHNEKEAGHNAVSHAELLCVEEACRILQRWRLSDCTLYVTMEPCPMCAGALWNARIGRIVFGIKDPVAGACGSVWSFADSPMHWKPETTSGIKAKECKELLSLFFEKRRQENDRRKEDRP